MNRNSLLNSIEKSRLGHLGSKFPIRVQFFSRDLPLVGTGGSGTYRLSLLRYLRDAGCEVQYVCLGYKSMPSVEPRHFTHYLWDTKSVSYIPPWNKNDQLSVWNDLPSRNEYSYFRVCLRSYQPDVIIVDRVWLAALLDCVPEGQSFLKVVLTHDVVHQRISAFKAAGLDPFKKNGGLLQSFCWDKEFESSQLQKAQVILAIQRADAFTFQKMAPLSEVIHMPMGILPCHSTDRGIRGRCLFVGGNASHNVDGITWFLTDVWPSIVKELPFATLHVCGNVCDSFPRSSWHRYLNVVFLGNLDSLNTEYDQAQVCIVPLRVGSGLKIKLVEALSRGRACVSTAAGVQGIDEVSRYGVVVTDAAEDYSRAVCKLLRDSQKRKSAEALGRLFASTHLSPDATYGRFTRKIYQHAQGLIKEATCPS